MPRYESLKAFDDEGLNIKIWCFECGRGAVVDAIIWQAFEAKGWPQDTSSATKRFKCRGCGKADNVMLLPTYRPQQDNPTTGERIVVSWFHSSRKLRKEERRKR